MTALAAVTVVLSIIALLISLNPFVTATAICGIILPPFSAYQEQKITDTKGKWYCFCILFSLVKNNSHGNIPAMFYLSFTPHFILLTNITAMKETNEAMERELNNLKFENERLGVENDKLEAAVDK